MGSISRSSSVVKSRPPKNRLRGPTSRTKIPDSVRPIIERVHERYKRRCAAEGGRAPAIDDPAVAETLTTGAEKLDLIAAGYWPIPPAVIRRGRSRKERERRRLIDLIREVVAEELLPALKEVGAIE